MRTIYFDVPDDTLDECLRYLRILGAVTTRMERIRQPWEGLIEWRVFVESHEWPPGPTAPAYLRFEQDRVPGESVTVKVSVVFFEDRVGTFVDAVEREELVA